MGKCIVRKKTPPWYGLSGGPIIVACQWNKSSPTGPAEHWAGGSLPKSCNSCDKKEDYIRKQLNRNIRTSLLMGKNYILLIMIEHLWELDKIGEGIQNLKKKYWKVWWYFLKSSRFPVIHALKLSLWNYLWSNDHCISLNLLMLYLLLLN